MLILKKRPLYAASGLPAGAVAMWKAENNTNDVGGNFNGTAGVGTAYATGYDGVNKAFTFSGNANQAITIPTINMAGAWSLDCWVKLGATGTSYYIVGDNPGTGITTFGAWAITASSSPGSMSYTSNLTARLSGAPAALSTFVQGNWYKATLTYDGSKVRIYVNNQLFFTETGAGHSETFNNGCKIGNLVTGTPLPFNGAIDELTFYNSAITPALNGNLIGHWVGNTSNDSEWTYTMIEGSTPLYTTDHNGVSNNAWSFNNSDNNIRQFQVGACPISSPSAWSLDFHLNVASGSAGTNRGVLTNAFNAANGQFADLVWLQANKQLQLWWNNAIMATTTTNSILAGSTWYRVKVTYDGTNFKIYIDTVLNVTSASQTGKLWNTSSNLKWGKAEAGFTSSPLIGAVADVKMYNAVV